jgi:hypothetical protein
MNSYDSVAIATAGAPGNNFDEMAAFFREQLPHPPSDKILHQLFEIEVDLRKKQINLAKQRRSREISDKEYAGRLTEALDFWKNETRRLLGEEDFDHVYGAAGHSPESIIDPANFQV